MIIEILQTRLIKVWVCLAFCLLLKDRDIKRCSCCGCELDVEDYFFNNICECCGCEFCLIENDNELSDEQRFCSECLKEVVEDV